MPLLPGGVADSNGLAARKPLHVLEGRFGQDPFPLHTEDGRCLAVGLTVVGDARHPREVSLGLVGARGLLEGIHD